MSARDDEERAFSAGYNAAVVDAQRNFFARDAEAAYRRWREDEQRREAELEWEHRTERRNR